MAPRSTTNRDHTEKADSTQTLPFECTYPKCIQRFATLKEMKCHKVNGADHYYCRKCNVDCEDWEALTQHKVTAMSPWVDGHMRGNREELPKHIICEFCGMEYKTFGARRMHREQFHAAVQSIVCPSEGCKTIFISAAQFICHLEDNNCEGVSAAEFRAYLEQNHVNKQIMKDTTISDRLQVNKATADLINGLALEDIESEYGGVSVGGTSSIIDADDDGWHIPQAALEPEFDLISLHDQDPQGTISRPSYPPLPASTLGTARSVSTTSRVPSVAGTELSASEYASRISRVTPGSDRDGSRSIYSELYPSLASPTYASSARADAASDVTACAGGSRAPSAWTTGATSRALVPDAKPIPSDEYDEDAVKITLKDLRQVRWWDPDHHEFEPDFFRTKDLMENKSFGCPFADCEDTYGYETLDVLKDHIRHAHLTIDHRCPCCHKKFNKPSSLMAHAESNGKCKVQASNAFKQLLSDISGGCLKAKRKPVPKVFRQDSAVVLADGTPVNGIMQTEYIAQLPKRR